MTLLRTTSESADFQALVRQLDTYLAEVNGNDHGFYNQFNGIVALNHAVVAYLDEVPVGCGAFKPFDEASVEIKRMFVDPTQRGLGVGRRILAELEQWASELGYRYCVLETSVKLARANHLYAKSGYVPMPKYGPYVDMPDSVCFSKKV